MSSHKGCTAQGRSSLFVQQRLPIFGNASSRTGHRLVFRMEFRRRKRFAPNLSASLEVPEPCLTRFETCDDWMPGSKEMLGCMLMGRAIAAPDVTALSTASQMEPPSTRGQALLAARSRRLGSWIDPANFHCHSSLFRCAASFMTSAGCRRHVTCKNGRMSRYAPSKVRCAHRVSRANQCRPHSQTRETL
jgi:hypothetical protein